MTPNSNPRLRVRRKSAESREHIGSRSSRRLFPLRLSMRLRIITSNIWKSAAWRAAILGNRHQTPGSQASAPGFGAPGFGAPGFGAPGFGAPGFGLPFGAFGFQFPSS